MHFFYILTEDETPTKSTVLGRPVLLALEDVDGAPSFLEKALRFVENHGISFRFFQLLLLLCFTHSELIKTTKSCRSQDRRNLETSCWCWWCWTPNSRIWERFEFLCLCIYYSFLDFLVCAKYLYVVTWFRKKWVQSRGGCSYYCWLP